MHRVRDVRTLRTLCTCRFDILGARMPRSVLLFASALVVLAAIACAEPPRKEMDQAQGAIDAARAAGADEYAAAELKAAVDALARAERAVTERDYRLALNDALDSRERAQNAAKAAVDGRAKARGNAERAIAEVDVLLKRARTRLADPEVASLPARIVRDPLAVVAAAEKALQEARSALKTEDYAKAIAVANGRATALQGALAAVDAAAAAQPGRRRR